MIDSLTLQVANDISKYKYGKSSRVYLRLHRSYTALTLLINIHCLALPSGHSSHRQTALNHLVISLAKPLSQPYRKDETFHKTLPFHRCSCDLAHHSIADLMSSRVDDPLDEPPPYTPRADPRQGESTVEYGPTRPFQPTPAVSRADPVPGSAHQPGFLSSQTSNVSRRGRSLWQQLTDQIDQFADELERRGNRANSNTQRAGTPWSSYPGRSLGNASSTLPPRRNAPPPPPRPPHRRTSSTSSLPSEFARDFYAAGTGDGLFSNTGMPSREMPEHEDRSPTMTPVPGRPLLRDGKLLVYPGGHTCEKCVCVSHL